MYISFMLQGLTAYCAIQIRVRPGGRFSFEIVFVPGTLSKIFWAEVSPDQHSRRHTFIRKAFYQKGVMYTTIHLYDGFIVKLRQGLLFKLDLHFSIYSNIKIINDFYFLQLISLYLIDSRGFIDVLWNYNESNEDKR